jgi:hypothetical protein
MIVLKKILVQLLNPWRSTKSKRLQVNNPKSNFEKILKERTKDEFEKSLNIHPV